MNTLEILSDFTHYRCKCGKGKLPETAFCKPCYHGLPADLRKALWQKFGSGFEEAYIEASEWLKENRWGEPTVMPGA